MFKPASYLLAFAAMFLLGACSTTPKANVDYDTAFDFSSIRSYALVDPQVGEPGATLAEQRIREAIVRNLGARGLGAVPPSQADVIVTYMVVTQDKTRVTTYNNTYGYAGYRRGYPYAWGGTEVDVRNYTEGTVIIDVVKPDEKRVVWRGASSAVLRDRTPEERRQLIDSHVDAIFAELPVPAR